MDNQLSKTDLFLSFVYVGSLLDPMRALTLHPQVSLR